jgi:hypothetical protein
MMDDPCDQLIRLESKLGRAWAKVEILLGLLTIGIGLFIGFGQLTSPKQYLSVAIGALGLFVLGGYLTLAGHRSHLYRWNNRNTLTLIDEIRRLQQR